MASTFLPPSVCLRSGHHSVSTLQAQKNRDEATRFDRAPAGKDPTHNPPPRKISRANVVDCLPENRQTHFVRRMIPARPIRAIGRTHCADRPQAPFRCVCLLCLGGSLSGIPAPFVSSMGGPNDGRPPPRRQKCAGLCVSGSAAFLTALETDTTKWTRNLAGVLWIRNRPTAPTAPTAPTLRSGKQKRL